jgi:hypothetical protein
VVVGQEIFQECLKVTGLAADISTMSASPFISIPGSTTTPQQSPFDFSMAPSAPRTARRCAPFVVLGGLIMYAVIVVTALTGPVSAGISQSPKSSPVSGPSALAGQSVRYGASHSDATVG